MGRILSVSAGRRAKWVVAGVWLVVVLVVGGLSLPSKFSDNEKNESTSFLPGDAESTKELQASDRLQRGEIAPIVIVYRRADGLTAADRGRIAPQRQQLNGLRLAKTSPFGAPVLSRDGKAALLIA